MTRWDNDTPVAPAGAAVDEGVRTVLRKVADLCDAGTASVDLGEPASPADFLEVVAGLARRHRRVTGAGEPRAMVDDLFDFLADPPPFIRRRIESPRAFGDEPAAARDEGGCGGFWQLAALVQDVWEHARGPEAAVDGDTLLQLAAIGDGPVYDFGAGAGFFAVPLARRGLSVTCIEAVCVKRAFLRRRADLRGLAARLTVGPLGRRARFRTALAINVLDHVRRPARTLAALARRLEPGGTLLCRAIFADDGWHTGGPVVRAEVRTALRRWFQYRPHSGPLATFEHRASAPRPGNRFQLDPAARIVLDPARPGCAALTAARPGVEPLLVTQACADLAAWCRTPRTAAQITDHAHGSGIEPGAALAALRQMLDAGLMLQEQTP